MKKLKWIAAGFIAVLVVVAAVLAAFPGLMLEAMARKSRADLGLERREITVDGLRWVYLEGGAGEPLVFIHGFNMDKDQWAPLSGDLRRDHRVIVPDLPGFGESSSPRNASYTVDVQAARLHRFIETLNAGPCHLAGVSMGGGIAAYYAARHPAAVRSLLLIGPYGLDCDRTTEFQDRYARGEFLLVFTNEAEFDRTMALVMDRPPATPGLIKRHFIRLALARNDFSRRIFGDQYERFRWNMLARELPSVAAPTLVVFGANERVFDASCGRRFGTLIRGAQVAIVPESGHLAYLDRPTEVLARYRGFLDSRR